MGDGFRRLNPSYRLMILGEDGIAAPDKAALAMIKQEKRHLVACP
jgi:hypothetical protein